MYEYYPMGMQVLCSHISRDIPMLAPVCSRRFLCSVVLLLGVLLAPLPGGAMPLSLTLTPCTETEIQLSTPLDPVKLLNRVTWGANGTSARQLTALGAACFLAGQLYPTESASLPAPVQAQIDAMTIAHQPIDQIVIELEQRRKDAEALTNDDDKKAAQQAYQQELTRVAREAATRALLRALYAPQQLHEQMVWFWMNHFNVHQSKHNIRALVGDYEER